MSGITWRPTASCATKVELSCYRRLNGIWLDTTPTRETELTRRCKEKKAEGKFLRNKKEE